MGYKGMEKIRKAMRRERENKTEEDLKEKKREENGE